MVSLLLCIVSLTALSFRYIFVRASICIYIHTHACLSLCFLCFGFESKVAYSVRLIGYLSIGYSVLRIMVFTPQKFSQESVFFKGKRISYAFYNMYEVRSICILCLS